MSYENEVISFRIVYHFIYFSDYDWSYKKVCMCIEHNLDHELFQVLVLYYTYIQAPNKCNK